MWEVKNNRPHPVESSINKIKFNPNQILVFELESLPNDILALIDKRILSAIRLNISDAKSDLHIEKQLRIIADEVFLDWELV